MSTELTARCPSEQQTLPFGDRLRALPIDALWHVAP
jgi:hypothetical protein